MSDTKMNDSGHRDAVSTGAVREKLSSDERWDLIPYLPMQKLAAWFGRGAKKYADRNWEKGLPLISFLNSASRHLFKLHQGDTDEDHATAVVWNMMAFQWTKDKIERGLLPVELGKGVLLEFKEVVNVPTAIIGEPGKEKYEITTSAKVDWQELDTEGYYRDSK